MTDAEPFLIVAALWTDGNLSDDVAAALRAFETPEGFHRGFAVSFRRDVADSAEFQRVMRKLNLAEMNERLELGERRAARPPTGLFDGAPAEAPLDWIACSDKQAREYFRVGFIVRRDRHGQWYVESNQHAEARLALDVGSP